MAAVIAAIGAAFLAGAIALYREHRQQQRKLLVAARVVEATFKSSLGGIGASKRSDRWAAINNLPGRESFSAAWETYKADLGGHLTWAEWVTVERAAFRYTSLLVMSKEKPPSNEDAAEVISKTEERLMEGREVLNPYCTKRLTMGKLLHRKLREAKGKR